MSDGSLALIVLSRASRLVVPWLWEVMCGASGAGASPSDGVFVPVSPVYLLTRPNRMTVSPGTRAGANRASSESA